PPAIGAGHEPAAAAVVRHWNSEKERAVESGRNRIGRKALRNPRGLAPPRRQEMLLLRLCCLLTKFRPLFLWGLVWSWFGSLGCACVVSDLFVPPRSVRIASLWLVGHPPAPAYIGGL